MNGSIRKRVSLTSKKVSWQARMRLPHGQGEKSETFAHKRDAQVALRAWQQELLHPTPPGPVLASEPRYTNLQAGFVTTNIMEGRTPPRAGGAHRSLWTAEQLAAFLEAAAAAPYAPFWLVAMNTGLGVVELQAIWPKGRDLVFAGRAGKMLKDGERAKAYKKLIKVDGLPHVRFHNRRSQ